MVLLLSGARHQVGARHSARQSGSGDSACRGLLDPLRLPYEFVVRRGAPGTCGAARVVPGAARRRGSRGLLGRLLLVDGPGCLRLGGRLLAARLRAVEPVRLQGVVQRRTTVPGAGRRRQRLGLRLRGQDRTVLRVTAGRGGRTRSSEVLVVPAALTRRRQTLVLGPGGLLLSEVGAGELPGARRVLAGPVLRAVRLRGGSGEVRAGELGGGAGSLPVVHGHPRRERRVHRPLELAGGLGVLVTARGVQRSLPRRGRLLGAPAGGLRTLRLRIAAGQLGPRAADRGQLTAGPVLAGGLLEAALADRVLPGLLRLLLGGLLPRDGAVALRAVLVLAVRGVAVLVLAVLAEQVGAARVRTARSVALAAGTEAGAVPEGTGEAAAVTLRLRAGGVLRTGAGQPAGLESGVLLTLVLLVLLGRLVAGAAVAGGQRGTRRGARTDLAARGARTRGEPTRRARGGAAEAGTGGVARAPGPPPSRPPGAPDCCPGACLGTGCLPPCATSTGSMTSAVVPPESEGRSWIRMP